MTMMEPMMMTTTAMTMMEETMTGHKFPRGPFC
jgi:hypothetical protein